jgi:XTP/dITP diphosphohydrolase
MNTLVIATHNVKKGVEMATILRRRFPDLEIRTLADYPGAPEPEETGTTYAENAAIKSEAAAALTGEWCVADDAGLEIDFFDGAPGLFSKRFAGEATSFPDKMALILREMAEVPDERRGARFRCLVALSRTGEPTRLVEGVCEGRIAREPAGAGGFGYDPIFYLPSRGCRMAELTADEKHAISHRGMALRQLGDVIEEMVGFGG